MMDDGIGTAKSRFQFDLRAIIAVTATTGVVLASVGRERVLELLLAACLFSAASFFTTWTMHRLQQAVPALRANEIPSGFNWMLLGALGAYIVMVSTDAYSDLRHRVWWAFACGVAALFGDKAEHSNAGCPCDPWRCDWNNNCGAGVPARRVAATVGSVVERWLVKSRLCRIGRCGHCVGRRYAAAARDPLATAPLRGLLRLAGRGGGICRIRLADCAGVVSRRIARTVGSVLVLWT